uniref:Defective in cullin neddylation protein n=1 Tax=Mycena chlorophos TaxID=658473 RepID=A0ABQ0LHG0_MYCCL|nr:predicted protein [Mycena chlorophos]
MFTKEKRKAQTAVQSTLKKLRTLPHSTLKLATMGGSPRSQQLRSWVHAASADLSNHAAPLQHNDPDPSSDNAPEPPTRKEIAQSRADAINKATRAAEPLSISEFLVLYNQLSDTGNIATHEDNAFICLVRGYGWVDAGALAAQEHWRAALASHVPVTRNAHFLASIIHLYTNTTETLANNTASWISQWNAHIETLAAETTTFSYACHIVQAIASIEFAFTWSELQDEDRAALLQSIAKPQVAPR